MYTLKDLQDKNLKELKEIGWQLNVFPEGDRRCRQNWIDALAGKNPPLLELLEVPPAVEDSPPLAEAIEVQAQEPIETPPGVESFTEADRPPGRGDGKRKSSTAHQLLEFFKSSAHIIPDSPAGEIEPKVSQSAIVPAAKNLPRSESDRNPILTGITLSSNFCARYSPPQSEIIHFQFEADGQLSLLDFTVETSNEPPDPDDFPTIDAFNTAMARWDAENAEMLAVSMDSMCEWARCPHEWYEPEGENLPLKASSMRELSEVLELSANFSIPTFDAWCDRAARQNDTDEPPDTGIGARLPGPKPPKFPPGAIGYTQTNQASRNYPETIPKLFSCIAADSSSQSGRSPPGGDAYQ